MSENIVKTFWFYGPDTALQIDIGESGSVRFAQDNKTIVQLNNEEFRRVKREHDVAERTWVRASDRLPTEADGDRDQEVYWCGDKFVRREKVADILKWDWTQPYNLAGKWMRTGVNYPDPP